MGDFPASIAFANAAYDTDSKARFALGHGQAYPQPIENSSYSSFAKVTIMPKFITNLHLDQYFTSASTHGLSSTLVLSSLAFPLSIVSGLLLLDGALSASITSAGIGVLGLVAAQAIKTRGQ